MFAKKIEYCRICGNSLLEEIINLGPQAIQGAFPTAQSVALELPRVPMSLVFCKSDDTHLGCGHLQTEHSISPDLMYREYWYRSGVTNSMREHLGNIVREMESEFTLDDTSSVLDIGCNDGTLLRSYQNSIRKVGVDPSNIIPIGSDDGCEYIHDFFPAKSLKSSEVNSKFTVITSLAMFYDIEDPVGFANEVRRLLTPDGLWVVEVSYMPKMIEEGWYDSICHEHLSYFSLRALEKIFEKSQFKIVAARQTETNGGSIICYITHQSNTRTYKIQSGNEIARLRKYEADLAIESPEIFHSFQRRASGHRDNLRSLIKKAEEQKTPVRIYGASTKGNTLLQWLGISCEMVDAAVDRDARKAGRFTPGTGVPIVNEVPDRADFKGINLVLPWHFRREILQREEASLAFGQSFIFPFPQISVVGNDNLTL